MARPIKKGLDYFFLDVDMDDKLELIEAKHDLQGFGVIVKLWQKIYKDEGYFLVYDEDTILLFAKRINTNIEVINAVISDCLKYGIFDREIFENYGVLTSAGIQKRYLTAVERRKSVDLIKQFIIVDINQFNVNINWINECKSTQSRVEKSRVEESRAIQKKENVKIQKKDPVPATIVTGDEQKADYIGTVIKVFQKKYQDIRGRPYVLTNKGKERSAAGKLLRIYKQHYPRADSTETLQGLAAYFGRCLEIGDNWLYNNMSLAIIINKFNEISTILSDEANQGNNGATAADVDDIIRDLFARPDD